MTRRDLTVIPGSPLVGQVSLPGDKSMSHRAALFAALAEGESRVENLLVAGVTRSMLRCLSGLGVDWSLEESTLTVRGAGMGGLGPPEGALDCGNSGTTLRLLAGALAGAGVPAVLDGSPSLRARPMTRVVEPLVAMGVPIRSSAGGSAPLTLDRRPSGRPLRGIDVALQMASAQVKSAVLLAGLAADGPTTLREPAPSRDHTERMLGAMGVRIEGGREEAVVLHPPEQPLAPIAGTLPGDVSSAAFVIVAALVTPGSDVRIASVGLNPTRIGLLRALRSMGARIEITPLGERCGEPVGDLRVTASDLRGTEVSGDRVVTMIDEFPAFAVAAAFARGPTVVRDAKELRFKESDRISVLCSELRALGVDVEERSDGFVVRGGKRLPGGRADARGDHRLAMALALPGLSSDRPVTVTGAEVMDESFPGFAGALSKLGARITLEEART